MNYLSTIIAVLILAVILIMAVRHIVRTKKQGGCVGCPHSSSCGSGSCCCGSCNTEEK
ncbi:MAG: FeoB-associated Cys-rich membrane protein [Clostridiales bacterium]|nr:FeoB-associated Cys-rich membrane protein [Clostridiales bacterium]MDD6540416.1 FeoB-associated Cys-rich membrane protein [Bacillota bacterium]MDD7015729.1 FeoB-associated Cys-rich membrane protein [Bacillota bacterium]